MKFIVIFSVLFFLFYPLAGYLKKSLFYPSPKLEESSEQFLEKDIFSANEIKITTKEGSLLFRNRNGRWIIPHLDYPANKGMISRLMSELSGLSKDQLLTLNENDQSRLGLLSVENDSTSHILIKGENMKTHQWNIGLRDMPKMSKKQAESYIYGKDINARRYVKFQKGLNSPEFFLSSSRLVAASANLTDWTHERLIPWRIRVSRLSIKSDDGTQWNFSRQNIAKLLKSEKHSVDRNVSIILARLFQGKSLEYALAVKKRQKTIDWDREGFIHIKADEITGISHELKISMAKVDNAELPKYRRKNERGGFFSPRAISDDHNPRPCYVKYKIKKTNKFDEYKRLRIVSDEIFNEVQQKIDDRIFVVDARKVFSALFFLNGSNFDL